MHSWHLLLILFIVTFCALSQQNIKAVKCCCSWASVPGKSSVKVIGGVVFKLGSISKWALLQMVLPAKSEVSKSGFQRHFWVLERLLPLPKHRNLNRLNQNLQEFIVRTLGCCQENRTIFLSYFFIFSISLLKSHGLKNKQKNSPKKQQQEQKPPQK